MHEKSDSRPSPKYKRLLVIKIEAYKIVGLWVVTQLGILETKLTESIHQISSMYSSILAKTELAYKTYKFATQENKP
jgi:hypothetical protein